MQPATPGIHLAIVALGGVLTALAFPLQPVPMAPPLALWPLCFLGPAPFLARLLTAASFADAARTGLTFALAWTLLAGVWVFRMFDALGWVLIWLPIGWVIIFALAAHLARQAGYAPAWSWPVLWLAVEVIRSEFTPLRVDWFSEHLDPLNITWFVLGHPRLVAPFFAQSADLIGGYGLSLTPLLTNLILAQRIAFGRWSLRLVIVTLVVAAADLGYCAYRWRERPAGTPVKVGVVQSERFDFRALNDWTDILITENEGVHIVVWPEESFTARDGDHANLLDYARRRDIALAVGVEDLTAPGGCSNRAWWLPPSGDAGSYAKQQRVPFVEQHPRSTECAAYPLVVGDVTIRCGILICYDMDYPWNPRRLVSDCGAELILMPTLDETSWGGTQHSQHALLPRLRAIENRRPVAQAATSGVSQIIDDHGRVLADVPFRLNTRPDRPTPYLEGFAVASIHPRSDLSPFTAGGYWVNRALALAGLLTVGSAGWRIRRN